MRKIKKILTTTLAVFLMFCMTINFSGCILIRMIQEVEKARSERREQLLAIEGVGGYNYITESSYIEDGEITRYTDIVRTKLKEEYSEFTGEIENNSCAVGFSQTLVFYSVFLKETSSSKHYVLGYLDTDTMAVHHYEKSIPKEWNGNKTFIEPGVIGPEYAHFQVFGYKGYYTRHKLSHFVIDVKNDCLIDNVEDSSIYKNTKQEYTAVTSDGKEYSIWKASVSVEESRCVLVSGEEKIALTYEYVLDRCAKMQEIDAVIGKYKKTVEEYIFIIDNKVLLVIESVPSPIIGELCPIIFEYTIETDSFEYIGCVEQCEIKWIVCAQ